MAMSRNPNRAEMRVRSFGKEKNTTIVATARAIDRIVEAGGLLPLEMAVDIDQYYFARFLKFRAKLDVLELEEPSLDHTTAYEIWQEKVDRTEKKAILYSQLAFSGSEKIIPYFNARLTAIKISDDRGQTIDYQNQEALMGNLEDKSGEDLAEQLTQITRAELPDIAKEKERLEITKRMQSAVPKKSIARVSDVVVPLKT